MKTIDQIQLTPSQQNALVELRHRLPSSLGIQSISLYGSVARGEANDESDIDLLIVTKQPLNRSRRHQITDIVCEINLQYNTNFSSLVVDHDAWENGVFTILPLKEDILREGVAL